MPILNVHLVADGGVEVTGVSGIVAAADVDGVEAGLLVPVPP